MMLPTFAVPGAALPEGQYVPADLAQRLEESLSKLSWTVLYGSAIEASSLAIKAERLVQELKAAGATA